MSARILSKQPPGGVTLVHRKLGDVAAAWLRVPMVPMKRGQVYAASLPPQQHDFEYYIEAALSAGTSLFWPPGAPALAQSVVVLGGPWGAVEGA